MPLGIKVPHRHHVGLGAGLLQHLLGHVPVARFQHVAVPQDLLLVRALPRRLARDAVLRALVRVGLGVDARRVLGFAWGGEGGVGGVQEEDEEGGEEGDVHF